MGTKGVTVILEYYSRFPLNCAASVFFRISRAREEEGDRLHRLRERERGRRTESEKKKRERGRERKEERERERERE